MKIIGQCLCNRPVHWDDDKEACVFTCREYPCELREADELEETEWKRW